MRVLHVGSFSGNIGDIANHHGFRQWFEKLLGKIEWHEFEIREVYRKNLAFDTSFVSKANQYDLVVIGGGNFFELWVDSSPTGTSISIEINDFRKIKVPVFFNALGVDDGMGCSDANLGKFKAFLNVLTSSEQYLVSVRNDGAMGTLKKRISDSAVLSKVLPLPDGGFFATTKLQQQKTVSTQPSEQPINIGINLAGDMLETRFPGGSENCDYAEFIREFSDALAQLWRRNKSIKFTFFPHIYSDLKVYADILAELPDACRREHVKVCSYDTNVTFEDTAFNEYANCTLILAMRFHANVVAIANQVPVLGLLSYKQIEGLFIELDLEKNLIDVRLRDFKNTLLHQCENILNNLSDSHLEGAEILKKIHANRNTVETKVLEWLSGNQLK